MSIEKYTSRKFLLTAGLLLAGSSALYGCSADEGVPSTDTPPAAKILDPEVVADPELKNYRIVEISSFWAYNSTVSQGVATYQESYDYQGKYWECSLSVSDGGKSGGVAKSCETTDIQQ